LWRGFFVRMRAMTVLHLHSHVDIRRQLILLCNVGEGSRYLLGIGLTVRRDSHLSRPIWRDLCIKLGLHLCLGVCLRRDLGLHSRIHGNLVIGTGHHFWLGIRFGCDLGLDAGIRGNLIISSWHHFWLGIRCRCYLALRRRIFNDFGVRARLHLGLGIRLTGQLGQHPHTGEHATHRLDRELKHGKQLFQRLLIHRHMSVFRSGISVLQKLIYTVHRRRQLRCFIRLHRGLIKLSVTCIHRDELLGRDIRHFLIPMTLPNSCNGRRETVIDRVR